MSGTSASLYQKKYVWSTFKDFFVLGFEYLQSNKNYLILIIKNKNNLFVSIFKIYAFDTSIFIHLLTP
jgi:hypothetical protein